MCLRDCLSCQGYLKWLLSLNHTSLRKSNLCPVLIGKLFNNQNGPALMILMGSSPKQPSSHTGASKLLMSAASIFWAWFTGKGFLHSSFWRLNMVLHIMKPLFSRYFAAHYKRKPILLEIMLSRNFLWSPSEEAFGEDLVAAQASLLCLRQLEGTTRKRVHGAERISQVRRRETWIFTAWSPLRPQV